MTGHGRVVQSLFENQAASNPNSIAVVFENQELSYAELNSRANRLAKSLIRVGVGPEVIVALCVERSADLIVGILGILKAGGAYLPLDPTYPSQRLAFMLSDAGASVLVTQRSLEGQFPQVAGSTIYVDDSASANELAEEYDNPARSCPENPAYVIYTSGSTGLPKGVVVTHENVVRLFAETQQWFHFGPSDVWTFFHSAAFDFSVWELWGALLYGGKLVVVPYHTSRSPRDFYRLLCNQKVTVLNQTPSAFRQLIRAEDALGVSNELSLRFVIFGGEALEVQGLRNWFERHGDRSPQLVNMYGITETTVHVTYRPLSLSDLARPGKGSPIGWPIPDLRVFVLDESLRPVPPGQAGEMYVGGAGVARGYLNRPELNAERFIRDPFSDEKSARLYKSGDLALVLPDGQLEFLGRADGQVKIRGFRIEVGEIEASLASCSTVSESVVVAREDVPGDRRLVAYVAARPGTTIDLQVLRNRLKETLPEYMVPALVMILDSLPLTPNGKVDRAALPAPEVKMPEDPVNSLGTDLEQRIRAIWIHYLRCNVGLDDNFFDLGGTSLHLAEVHAELTKFRGEDLPIVMLLECPTVRSLAARLAGSSGANPTAALAQARAKLQRESFARQKNRKGSGT